MCPAPLTREEQDKELVRLWNEGYTAGAIAGMWGGECTRNVIIGRVTRLRAKGVALRCTADPAARGKEGARFKRVYKARKRAEAAAAPVTPPAPLPAPEPCLEAVHPAIEPASASAHDGVPYLQHKFGQCSFILDGLPRDDMGLLHVCGKPIHRPGASMCTEHHTLTWRTVKPRSQ